MKRVLSLVLALSMVLGMFSFAFAGSNLKDITGTDYEAAVGALTELGVVNGYTDGTFQPEKVVTRAEMAKLLVVSAGLEPAADVAKGATRFSDVAGSHWASGYVNVAAEYGYIVGYPDGTFAPDKTVTYAEAVTMALRVLGYRTVVESKGTWPTNYIAKAGDLKMLEDITYGSYSDGAKRGNVAKLIWNMLRTRMWDVTGESEGNGLEYSKAQMMLDVKFPDYTYDTVEFESFSIKDGEVTIKLIGDKTKYAYEGADFYTFVKGTEVEVLLNEKDETILTIVPTDRDALVDGTPADLEDDDYENVPEGDYVYAMVDGDTVSGDATILTVNSVYVYEVKEQSSGIKVNGGSTVREKDFDKKVVLKDGARISYGDIEAGVVLSTVTVDGQEFYVVSEETAEGKFTKYVNDELTIGGEKYTEAPAEYVIDPDKDGAKKGKALASANEQTRKDMKNEEVVAYLDFLGRVARIDFDGALGDEESSTDIHFYVVKSLVEKESAGVYAITLENEDGEKDFTFEKNNTDAADLYRDDDKNEALNGAFVAVKFNDDGEIMKISKIAKANSGDGEPDTTSEATEDDLIYGEKSGDTVIDNEYYVVEVHEEAEYDKDREALVFYDDDDYSHILVDEDTILVTLTYDKKGTSKTSDDEYVAEFAEGIEAIENIKNGEVVVVIYDAAEKITTPRYVLRFKDTKNSDDVLAGKVEDAILNKLGTEYTVTVDGEDYILRAEDGEGIEELKDGVIVFRLEEDGDDEYMNIIAAVPVADVRDIAANEADYQYVDAVKGNKVSMTPGLDIAINDFIAKEADGTLIVTIDVNASAADPKVDASGDPIEGEYDVDDEDVVLSVSEVVDGKDIESSMFEVGDRVIHDGTLDEHVMFILKGLEELTDEEIEELEGI